MLSAERAERIYETRQHEWETVINAAHQYWHLIPRKDLEDIRGAIGLLKMAFREGRVHFDPLQIVKACVTLGQAFDYSIRKDNGTG